MKIFVVLTIMLAAAAVALSEHHETVLPAKISKAEVAGAIFEREDMTETKHENGNLTLDVTTLLSSDKKFASGMYRSGKSYFEAKDAYGVDEFMYFLEGSVKLTSADGSVQVIGAGEAVTIPKEWTGIWDTDGYTKLWVIYSEDGSGL
jgi:uncharacterized cupin superfamily protein